MRVLFDIGHPADVHLFRNAIVELDATGHDVRVTSRVKDLTVPLLDAYGIPHTPLSTEGDSMFDLATEWAARELRLLREARSFRPDVIACHLSPPAAHVARLTGTANVVFNDGENERLAGLLTYPFADVICTPANFSLDLGPRQLRYDGFHELAYLHPERFTPDPGALERAGVAVDEPYFVLRFVSWGAHHDVGHHGLSAGAKRELVSFLARRGAVYVSSEAPLPPDLRPYRLPIPPSAIHDLLYYADAYVGDSGTMATEAAVLGTPAVRISSFTADGDMSNFVELEHAYDLLHSTADERAALRRVRELVADPDAASRWTRRRDRLVADKIDVTDFMIERISAASRA